MGVFFWRYDLEPEFPLCVLEYETAGADDLMHSHDYLEVALCLDGAGVFRFGHREYEIAPGDVFLVDNLEPHVAHAAPGCRLRLLLVLFLPELIAAPGCRPFDTAYLSPFLDSGAASPRIPHDTGLAASLRPILLEVQAAAGGRSPSDRYVVDADLRRFLAAIIKERSTETAPQPVRGGEAMLQIGPALAYVGEHYREPVTLQHMAGTMHVSESRARHVFKEVTGVGFKEYVTKLRLAEAKRLLLKTEIKVCDVALAVGYTNIHQFYKVFYRYTRMSPADYRHYYALPSSPRPGLVESSPRAYTGAASRARASL